ncbi:MAG: hypothetical protein D6773_12220, partial [Alphaproteobacteria bacterium]
MPADAAKLKRSVTAPWPDSSQGLARSRYIGYHLQSLHVIFWAALFRVHATIPMPRGTLTMGRRLTGFLLALLFVAGCTPKASQCAAFPAPRTSIPLSSTDRDRQASHPDAEIPRATAHSDPLQLGLEQAVHLALRMHPDVESAQARITQAEALLSQAKAPFWPRIDAYSRYTTGDAPSSFAFTKLDQRRLDITTDFNDPGSFHNFESGLTARFNLFRGGRDRLQNRAARIDKEAAQWGLAAVRNRLAAAVLDASYRLLTAREQASIAADSVETVQARLRERRIQFE